MKVMSAACKLGLEKMARARRTVDLNTWNSSYDLYL